MSTSPFQGGSDAALPFNSPQDITAMMARLGLSRLPAPVSAQHGGSLHLKFGAPALMERVATLLAAQGWKSSSHGDVLRIETQPHLPQSNTMALVNALSHALPVIERQGVRALWLSGGKLPDETAMWEVEPLQSWVTRQQNGWLLDMMRNHRLQSVYQPIVSCTRPSEVFAYECLMRGRDGGKSVSPTRILDAARGNGLLFQLDFAARRTAITGAARHRIAQKGAKVFINFTPMDSESALLCLRSTLDIVDELRLPRESIVFEVIESEFIPDAALFRTVLDAYRQEGFGVALDDLGAGYASLNLLARLRPDYVKLDMELTRDVHCDSYKALIARKLIETARELDIRIVAEGIECHEEAEWVCAHGCDYAQGFYYALPESPPPSLVVH